MYLEPNSKINLFKYKHASTERRKASWIIIYYEILINSIISIKVELGTSRKFLS